MDVSQKHMPQMQTQIQQSISDSFRIKTKPNQTTSCHVLDTQHHDSNLNCFHANVLLLSNDWI